MLIVRATNKLLQRVGPPTLLQGELDHAVGPVVLHRPVQSQCGHQLRDRVVGDLPAVLTLLDPDARAALGATGVVEHPANRGR